MKIARPPGIWIAWTIVVVALIVLGLFGVGCATTDSYSGPPGKDAIVKLTQRRHIMQRGPRDRAAVETISTLHVTNPSNGSMTVVVSCDGESMSKTGGTEMTLDVPARTTQHLLLLPEDHACVVKRVR